MKIGGSDSSLPDSHCRHSSQNFDHPHGSPPDANDDNPSGIRMPRSHASIAFALDELERELDAEELGIAPDALESDRDPSASPPPPPMATGSYLADDPVPCHPLNFASQYPHMTIVTTASLPWLTGTAVNPSLRAAHLWNRGHAVSLLVPWVTPAVQPRLFPDGMVFTCPAEQAAVVAEAIQCRVSFELPPFDVIDGTTVARETPELTVIAAATATIENAYFIGSGEGRAFQLESESILTVDEQAIAVAAPSAACDITSGDDEEGTQPDTSNRGVRPFRLIFYPGRYDSALGSIMPVTDLQALVPLPVDCIVLEEPEHLTWYHTGRRWTRAFHRTVPVIGIMHTNYVDYARRVAGDAAAGTLKRLNRFLCRQHTHKCIKLSDAVQRLPRQETCFVHGVSEAFLAVGARKAEELLAAAAAAAQQEQEQGSINGTTGTPTFPKGIYFLGKALWAKGFAELLDRFTEHVEYCKAMGTKPLCADIYGKGEQLEAIQAEAARRSLPLHFKGAKDHLSPDIADYRCFINPSTSDVVATTSAEALAMGKWLVVPRHPCNVWLSTFSNCLVYDDPQSFSAAMQRVHVEDPAPLTADDRSKLSWEAATDRFLHCCASVEVERGTPLARVAAMTGWVGYNVGYQVYSVVSRAIESVRKSMKQQQQQEQQRDLLLSSTGSGSSTGQGGVADRITSHAIDVSPSLGM